MLVCTAVCQCLLHWPTPSLAPVFILTCWSLPSFLLHCLDSCPAAILTHTQVLQKRQGVSFRVNMKERGDCFGEVSLMYSCPRTATVAATTDATVWVLHRDVFR
jgi:hypothetical protein